MRFSVGVVNDWRDAKKIALERFRCGGILTLRGSPKSKTLHSTARQKVKTYFLPVGVSKKVRAKPDPFL
jgi:hypothetical protein